MSSKKANATKTTETSDAFLPEVLDSYKNFEADIKRNETELTSSPIFFDPRLAHETVNYGDNFLPYEYLFDEIPDNEEIKNFEVKFRKITSITSGTIARMVRSDLPKLVPMSEPVDFRQLNFGVNMRDLQNPIICPAHDKFFYKDHFKYKLQGCLHFERDVGPKLFVFIQNDSMGFHIRQNLQNEGFSFQLNGTAFTQEYSESSRRVVLQASNWNCEQTDMIGLYLQDNERQVIEFGLNVLANYSKSTIGRYDYEVMNIYENQNPISNFNISTNGFIQKCSNIHEYKLCSNQNMTSSKYMSSIKTSVYEVIAPKPMSSLWFGGWSEWFINEFYTYILFINSIVFENLHQLDAFRLIHIDHIHSEKYIDDSTLRTILLFKNSTVGDAKYTN